VLGANGVVGSRIAARLAKEGEEVVAVGRGAQRLQAKVQYRQLDLSRQADQLAELIADVRPRGVINAAAMTNVDACESNREEAWTLNVDLVAIAARAATATGARFTTLSTDYVFDGVKGSYSEEDFTNPGSVYGITKRDGENAALVLAGDCAVGRVAVVYSGFR